MGRRGGEVPYRVEVEACGDGSGSFLGDYGVSIGNSAFFNRRERWRGSLEEVQVLQEERPQSILQRRGRVIFVVVPVLVKHGRDDLRCRQFHVVSWSDSLRIGI